MAKRRKNDNKFLTFIFIVIGIIYILDNSGYINISSAFKNDESETNVISTNSSLEVQFIDVGQADSILIRSNDKNMLIDAGNNEDGKKLVKYLEDLGIKSFEYVVGTHPHEDHIGGMDNIIDSFDINTFYMPDAITTTKTFETVLDSLANKGKYLDTPKIDSEFKLGEATFKVLYTGTDIKDLNNTSIVLLMTYGNVKFLFTGDATSEVEKILIEKDIKADVLKVGHHGSQYSSTQKFLNKVNPKYAVIQVGKDNTYKHPREETLNKLKNMNVKIYRTDINGTIVATTDGNTINFRSFETDTNG